MGTGVFLAVLKELGRRTMQAEEFAAFARQIDEARLRDLEVKFAKLRELVGEDIREAFAGGPELVPDHTVPTHLVDGLIERRPEIFDVFRTGADGLMTAASDAAEAGTATAADPESWGCIGDLVFGPFRFAWNALWS